MVNKIKMVQRLGGKASFNQPKSPTRPTSFSARQSVNVNRKFVNSYSRSDLRSRPAPASAAPDSTKTTKSTNPATSTSQSISSNSVRNLSTPESHPIDSIRPNFIPSWLRKK